MQKLRWLALAVLAIAVLAVAGCGDDDDGGGGGGGGGEASGEPIKLGASLPLTGEFSEPGKAARRTTVGAVLLAEAAHAREHLADAG